jgi:hypothetical protein
LRQDTRSMREKGASRMTLCEEKMQASRISRVTA